MTPPQVGGDGHAAIAGTPDNAIQNLYPYTQAAPAFVVPLGQLPNTFNTVITANDCIGCKITAPRTATLNRLRWTSGGATAGNYAWGIYSADGQTRLWTSGQLASPASTTVTDHTPNIPVVIGQQYWVVYGTDTGVGNQTQGYLFPNAAAGTSIGMDGQPCLTRNAAAYSAGLPATFTVGTGICLYMVGAFLGFA